MRRFVIVLLSCLAGLLLALATLPWWFGPVLKTGAGRFGAQFGRYERLGYSRFAVHDVVVVRRNVRVTAARAETETPLLWLWHHVMHKPANVAVSTWQVDVKASDAPAVAPTSESGAKQTRAILFRVANALERWLPRAEVGEGKVNWPNGGLQIGSAQWSQRTLKVGRLRALNQEANVEVTFTSGGEITLDAKPTDDSPWSVALKSSGDRIEGPLRAWGQVAPFVAELPESGWIPKTARVEAKAWEIPAAPLRLGDSYSVVRGDAWIDWREGRLETTADLRGEIVAGKAAPPLSAKLHAAGDQQSVRIDSLNVDIPGATARLSDVVEFRRQGAAGSPPSQFNVDVDLAKLPWLSAARGRLTGRAQISPINGGVPVITATLSAADLSLDAWAVAQFNGQASLQWPRLTVSEATFGFSDGGKFTARGGWDFKARELIDAAAQGTVRAAAVTRWLPPTISFESLEFSGTARGALATLHHEGRAEVTTLKWGTINPAGVTATWKGEGSTVEISRAQVREGMATIDLAGSVGATSARITALKFSGEGQDRLTLTKPAEVRWSPAVEIDAVDLAGPESALTVSAGLSANGRLAVTAKNLPSAWAKDFVALAGPDWRIVTLDGQATWRDGPATFSLKSEVGVSLSRERTANVSVSTRGGADGIDVEALQVSEGAMPIVNATGRLPVSFQRTKGEWMRIDRTGALALNATTTSNPAFWTALAEITGVSFQSPEVQLAISGTWAEPKGEVTATATSIMVDAARVKFPLPSVESLDLQAAVDAKGVTLDRLGVSVEKQVVRANGRLSFRFAQWDELKTDPVTFLRREGSFRLEIPDAEISALAARLPGYLAPVGRIQIDAEISPGGELSGGVRLRDAATRPLGPLGIMQEIQADAQLTGETIVLKNLSAVTGGQPVTVSGKIRVPVGAAPSYDLALKGENLPLVRRTGLLMRADIDLKLITQKDGITDVTGVVNLRDSMFLSDVRALIPRGGGGGPARRPPFFSVDTPPVNAWRLGIEVRGEEFLRLRSAVFVGVASAHFRLGGTLGEPRATGEASVESGQVLLPFAAFRVEQGTVQLTEADPYDLRLYLTGTSRRYGYDLRMELTGTATEPVLAFSSNPPLEAKQVLLMVTAGETPKDEVNYSGTQRVTRLGTYLGQSLINNFGGDAADADRLSISSGERVSRQGRETYDIEYRLSDRFTLVGEYDEFDDYNAGVRWKFLPRSESGKKKEKGKDKEIPPPAEKKELSDAPPR